MDSAGVPGGWPVAEDFRFPNPKFLRREFIELIRIKKGGGAGVEDGGGRGGKNKASTVLQGRK